MVPSVFSRGDDAAVSMMLRLQSPGWDEPGQVFARSAAERRDSWTYAHQVEPPGGRLVSEKIDPIKIMGHLSKHED